MNAPAPLPALFLVCLAAATLALRLVAAEPATTVEVNQVAVDGRLDNEKARLVIEADLKGLTGPRAKAISSVTVQHLLRITPDRLNHAIGLQLEAIQGDLREVALGLDGTGEVRQVAGEALEDWSVRQTREGGRALVLRFKRSEVALKTTSVQVTAETVLTALPQTVTPLAISGDPAALGHGYVRIDVPSEVDVQVANPVGVAPVDLKFLPEPMRTAPAAGMPAPLAFQFHGTAYRLPLTLAAADPESTHVVLGAYRLTGELSEDRAAFTLSAVARVKNPKGGSLALLGGDAALTEAATASNWRWRIEEGRFVARFDQPGEYPIQIKFHAAVRATNGWNRVAFTVAPGVVSPVVLQGLQPDTAFEFAGAARPERSGTNFVSFLPPNGVVLLAWKPARPEAEGALFYAAEALSQVTISPGLMRQTAVLEGKVMQGELARMTLRLHGTGEVTRVQGPAVLAWSVEPIPNTADRRLVVQLNQAQKDQFAIMIQLQTPLGAFPQAVEAVQIQPEGTTRFGGYFRVVNEGAVRLEVVQASGLSQISPEQFPQTDVAKALLSDLTSQIFAYRFSGGQFQLRVQADNILPELAVSGLYTYHLGETELAIEAELEVDVREAPLRELVLRVPRGYAVARLNAAGLSDYFPSDNPAEPDAQLRLVYGTPVAGRQVLQLRLERNQPWTNTAWRLPRLDVAKAKSVRGQLAVIADAGFRLSVGTTQGLTEMAAAFFPKKLPGLQAAFRLSDPAWQGTFNVERLPQSIQADAFHLFSVGEGIAYGSSLVSYLVAGAPIAAFKVELSDEYFNVEFSGKEVRNWAKVDGGYVVQLHTPVSGAYTLLATYERPFKAQGEKLTFTGLRPLDAQSEQGHTIIVSTYQFQVVPAALSGALLLLEPGEVPAEYRLFFDAPVLAAYRYTARPFNLQLELKPLAQAETISQVVDRASLVTRVSSEGQVVTEARYFVKNKGTPHLRVIVPAGAELWSVTVNGAPVVPIANLRTNLIPLPQQADPNQVNDVQLKLAARNRSARAVTVTAPSVTAPVLLAEWLVQPDTARRLEFRRGSLVPLGGRLEITGFDGLLGLFHGAQRTQAWPRLGLAFGLFLIGIWAWRSVTAEGVGRFTPRHVLGGLLGLVASGLAFYALTELLRLAGASHAEPPRELRFIAPIQQPESVLTLELGNVAPGLSAGTVLLALLPALLGIGYWAWRLVTGRAEFLTFARLLAWTGVAWSALRWPNGAPGFFAVLLAFATLEVVFPCIWRWFQVRPLDRPSPPSSQPAATAALVLLLAGATLGSVPRLNAQPQSSTPPPGANAKPAPLADVVTQDLRVQEDFVSASARVRWQATPGQVLPLLRAPGVLTRIDYPTNLARLVQVGTDGRLDHALLAEKAGAVDVSFDYQTRTSIRDGAHGFVLPTAPGLVNQVGVTLLGLEVEVNAAEAVSVQPDATAPATNTVARLVLRPAAQPWISWKPRSRDTRREKAVIYAELAQVYVPGAGVVEGLHSVAIRPAQGELSEVTFLVPVGSTITDVEAPGLTLWRFDPDARQLRAQFSPAQSRPFTLQVKSQLATGPLPFEQRAGLLLLQGAAGQLGLIGLATGAEVQLDDVRAEACSPINLEDFPAALLEPLRAQVAGLTLRRAFRYSDPQGALVLKASPVEPDVRVEAQQTLSLGEDRTVLAANLEVEVTRAGIFKLSFVLPSGLDVESISGGALSHWTELATDGGRVVTLHLKSKTEGKQAFAVTLSGAGLRSPLRWTVPRLAVREASKQRGQLLLVPEQGLRLQVATRDGLTQLDPLKAGVRQKGVLAFRLLQNDWSLGLDVERVDAWTQVNGLQHVVIGDAQVKVAVNLQYDIENTGVKSLRVRLPAAAEGVRFRGDQLADFRPVEGATNDATRDWEIKLSRRFLGKYLLQLNYTLPVGDQAAEVALAGVEAQEVNLQRGFVSVQAGGRLQLRVETPPAALQPAEWQSIPRALQQDIAANAANYTFRLVEPSFRLPVKLERHPAAKLLPARVNQVTLTSVLSDNGIMLTQARVQLQPGDKRLLRLTLPARARFWFAFVNQGGVWPWRETNQVLIPLELPSKSGEPTTVEFFYSSQPGTPDGSRLDLSLAGPKFDLPLENITWRLYLGDRWQVTRWQGALQLQEQTIVPARGAIDLGTYVRNEAALQKERTKEAEQFLTLANNFRVEGDQQQARRAFQNAYGLSQHDNAFNEDARVQLHNLKMEQALVGLNFREAKLAGESSSLAAAPRGLRDNQNPTYTPQQAKQLLERNSAEDNAVQLRLAERLVQQQDAAAASPAAIRTAVPEQGRLLTFARPLLIDPWAELNLQVTATSAGPSRLATRLFVLVALLAGLALLRWMVRVPAAQSNR